MGGGQSQIISEVMHNLIVKPEAENDLQVAFLYYEEKRIGLGYDFVNSIEATIHQVRRNPLAFQVKHKNIRRAYSNRFPFGVYYLVGDFNIYVLAFVHTRMSEEVWQNRKF